MKNIIFIVNIKNPQTPLRNTSYDLSIQSWKKWAEKYDIEVFVLDTPIISLDDMAPNFQRIYVFDLLQNEGIDADQILMVDADTIIHPECPNFFEETNHELSAVHNDGDYDWMCRSIENYEYEFFGSQKVDQKYFWQYFNSGFIITNKNFKFMHDEILSFYWNNKSKIQEMQKKYGVGTDQPLINMLVRNKEWKINILPYRYNMQDLSRKNVLNDRMLFTQIPGVYHFNAIEGGPSQSNYWIEKTYRYFYN